MAPNPIVPNVTGIFALKVHSRGHYPKNKRFQFCRGVSGSSLLFAEAEESFEVFQEPKVALSMDYLEPHRETVQWTGPATVRV